jgi:hypothetical protein
MVIYFKQVMPSRSGARPPLKLPEFSFEVFVTKGCQRFAAGVPLICGCVGEKADSAVPWEQTIEGRCIAKFPAAALLSGAVDSPAAPGGRCVSDIIRALI